MNTPRASLSLSLIAALGLVAWADGALMPGEARLFVDVLDGLDLPAEDRLAAMRSLLVPLSDVRAISLAELSDQDRRQVLRFAYAMANADGSISDKELTVIREIGAHFGFQWVETIEIVGHPIAW